MRRWIETVAGHYRGQIVAWDVVNEICGPGDARADALRRARDDGDLAL